MIVAAARWALAVLSISCVAALLEPATRAQGCQSRALPTGARVVVSGLIDQSDCVVLSYRNAYGEFWTFQAEAGDLIVAQMLSAPAGSRPVVDPYRFSVDIAGNVLSVNDDAEQTADARTAFGIQIVWRSRG